MPCASVIARSTLVRATVGAPHRLSAVARRSSIVDNNFSRSFGSAGGSSDVASIIAS